MKYMKTLKTTLAIVLSTVGLGSAVALGVSSGNNVKFLSVSATAPTNTRRIWIVDNNGDDGNSSFWTGKTMYAYAWTTQNNGVTVKVTNKVLDDYSRGLWYVDVSLENAATDALKVIIRIGDDNGAYAWGNNNQTFTQSLPAFGEEDTIWLNNGVTYDDGSGRNSRNASIGTAGCSAAQLAVVMSKYNTCSTANTNGYNAYPQVDTNFIKTSDASVMSTKVYGQDVYTIQDYIDAMSTRYTNQSV